MHLVAQDPSQLRSILQEVAARQDVALERKQALLRDLKGDLHPAEYAEWAQRFMGEPLPYSRPRAGRGDALAPLPVAYPSFSGSAGRRDRCIPARSRHGHRRSAAGGTGKRSRQLETGRQATPLRPR